MTEHGHFWAVEDGESVELFRAVARRTAPNDLLACHSAVEAARRFLLLHPRAIEEPVAAVQVATPGAERPRSDSVASGETAEACQVCGATFTRRRQSGRLQSTRSLCPRCRHAERERIRYQQDPRYRARRLAYSAARYRRTQQADDGDI
jgi:hypothetical protein